MTDPFTSGSYVTDGGLETDLIFNRAVDLPEFASFPLLGSAEGRAVLTRYYDEYAQVAREAGAGLVLESPTWRANADWATGLGYDAAALDQANRAGVDLVHRVRDSHPDLHDTGVVVSGNVGPRGDGYVAGGGTAEDFADYHAAQVSSFRAAGVDVVTAMTMTTVAEAMGVVSAARAVGLPVVAMFTVETDGRLPDGTPLAEAVAAVDAAGGPDWFGINCAHPEHIDPGLTEGGWLDRVVAVRPNASRLSHAELDEAEDLDEGDPVELRADLDALRGRLPSLRVVGGCCGTDVRHVASLWGVAAVR